MPRKVKENRLQLARECLRLVWQTFDAGGHSMGRSWESTLLEAAMEFIEPTSEYSKLADTDRRAFMKIVQDELRKVRMKKMADHDKEMFEEL